MRAHTHTPAHPLLPSLLPWLHKIENSWGQGPSVWLALKSIVHAWAVVLMIKVKLPVNIPHYRTEQASGPYTVKSASKSPFENPALAEQ